MANTENAIIVAAREKFELACQDAQQLTIVNNFGAAFVAVGVVNKLREALSDEIMNEVFMPLMNTTIGFRTDRDPNRSRGKQVQPYPVNVVRDAIIDAVAFGLMTTGNQFNIISERMYPTKEGYTALLRKIGCKYFISYSAPTMNQNTADVVCKIGYEFNGEKNSFSYTANVKKDDYSSIDQIKGKAERKAKKVLYEYLTGVDLGDADETSSEPDDQSGSVNEEIAANANRQSIGFSETPAEEPARAVRRRTALSEPNTGFENEDMPEFMK